MTLKEKTDRIDKVMIELKDFMVNDDLLCGPLNQGIVDVLLDFEKNDHLIYESFKYQLESAKYDLQYSSEKYYPEIEDRYKREAKEKLFRDKIHLLIFNLTQAIEMIDNSLNGNIHGDSNIELGLKRSHPKIFNDKVLLYRNVDQDALESVFGELYLQVNYQFENDEKRHKIRWLKDKLEIMQVDQQTAYDKSIISQLTESNGDAVKIQQIYNDYQIEWSLYGDYYQCAVGDDDYVPMKTMIKENRVIKENLKISTLYHLLIDISKNQLNETIIEDREETQTNIKAHNTFKSIVALYLFSKYVSKGSDNWFDDDTSNPLLRVILKVKSTKDEDLKRNALKTILSDKGYSSSQRRTYLMDLKDELRKLAHDNRDEILSELDQMIEDIS